MTQFPTSVSNETEYEEQVLQSNGQSLLQRTIDFIGKNVSISDVFTDEQIAAYCKTDIPISSVYDYDDIKDYAQDIGYCE